FMDEMNAFILVVLMLGFVVLSIIAFYVVEYFYAKLFHKPIFVHLYFSPKTLTQEQQRILREKIIFYNRLSDKKKKYFEHRLATFMANYQFITKEELVLNEEIKVFISATAVKLTFGMR